MKLPFMKVSEAMTRHAVHLRPDDHLIQAQQLMQRCGFHHIPVIDDGALVGIVSDRDLLRSGLATEGMTFVGQRMVKDVMTSPVVTCRAEQRVGDAIDIMIRKHINALVVTNAANEVLGVLTSTDLLMALRRYLGVTDFGALLAPSEDAPLQADY